MFLYGLFPTKTIQVTIPETPLCTSHKNKYRTKCRVLHTKKYMMSHKTHKGTSHEKHNTQTYVTEAKQISNMYFTQNKQYVCPTKTTLNINVKQNQQHRTSVTQKQNIRVSKKT